MKSPHSPRLPIATPHGDCSGFRAPAASLAALLGLSSIAMPALAGPNPALEAEIKQLVDAYRTENKIPGLTVSVTRNGIPLFAQGYGQATDTKPMTADHRTGVGSVTKVLLNSPAGDQAIKNSGKFTLQSTLYGNGGVFGQKFANDITIGVQRHTPIVGMAVAKNDQVYTWYANGKFSVGTFNDLAKYQAPAPYVPAQGRKTSEILGMTFMSDDKVLTWYRTKDEKLTCSIGKAADLDTQFPEFGVTPAKGKGVYNIVGIGRSKTNNHVYTWYEDGTLTEGNMTNLGAHTSLPVKFATPAGLKPYDLREIDFGADGHVRAWYRNGQISAGSLKNLGDHDAPKAYIIPEAGYVGGDNWYPWYANITVQHLLRHESGFTENGDGTGAALMFGKTLGTLTYEEGHRHFLRTRPLLSAPGADYNYSNHGFGLWTLLMPAITGQSYLDYIVGQYLKPMGLDDDVIPADYSHDALDAAGYVLDKDDKFVALPFKPAESLAAGGWRSSARSMTTITAKLDAKYSPTELVNLGWAKTLDGRLWRNGGLPGGMSIVMLFPAKYVSKNGQDMGGIHVALAANIWNTAAPQESLAFQIAERVAKTP